MTVERIRQAAATLRRLAADVPEPAPWAVLPGLNRVAGVGRPGMAMAVADVYPTGGSKWQRAAADFMAAMDPAVAEALADWLDATAADAVNRARGASRMLPGLAFGPDEVAIDPGAVAVTDAVLGNHASSGVPVARGAENEESES